MKNYVIVEKVKQLQVTFEPGSIVECVKGGSDDCDAGKILIATGSTSRPFVTISDGSLWGDDFTGYEFALLSLPGPKIHITPAFEFPEP